MSYITPYTLTKFLTNIYVGIAFINSVPEGTYDVIILDAFQPMGKKAFFLSIFYLKLELM